MTPEPTEGGAGLSTRSLTHLVYGLFALGPLTGGALSIATIAAIVLAYIKRPETAGTVYAAHFDWIISTFWWGLLWVTLSVLATFLFIGWLTGLVALVWIVYRIIKGWLALSAGQPPTQAI